MTQHAKTNTASAAYLRTLIDYAASRGTAEATLLAGSGMDPSDGDARFSESACAALFDRAAELLGDDAVGLHAGEHIRPGHYGVFGYVVMNCATLGDALAQLQRYQALVIDIGPPEVVRDGAELTVSWNPRLERPLRRLAEFNLSAMIAFARWVSGRDESPLRADFTFPAPADTGEHQRIFRCPLRWDEPVYRIVLAASWLEAPLIRPDPTVRALMLDLAEKQLLSRSPPSQLSQSDESQLSQGDDDLGALRELVAKSLPEGNAALARVASALSLSPRTLQRKLKERGQSFSSIVDDVRSELATRHLANGDFDLDDLAFLLGFSEQSAFQRAFKRWTGEAPGSYRKRVRGRGM
ncbi:AraC family transcriptional regulator ligand-binding domain-containing protein [Pendulispora albinea]|uniref:AraC family transcriptional regulator n=1 Tax=Pendulispora albinea TaxID=2741071 RepID=A0ABZ2M6Y4_9BACT